MTKQIFLWLIIVITILTGCMPTGELTNTPANNAATGLNFESFVEALRAEGTEATPADSFTSMAFTGDTRLVQVNGEDVQVYEYADAAVAAQEAGYINPDGSGIEMPDPENPDVRQVTSINWIGTPHFYRNGRLIVQYIGDNQEIIALLEKVLGPQFAGGVSEEKLPLIVGKIEPPEGAAMSFEEVALQADSVVLAEVVGVTQGPDYIGSVEIPVCKPSQLVTLRVLKAYKGSLGPNERHTIYLEGGITDSDTGCGDNPSAEKVIMIMEHDPLYEHGQRYLLALRHMSFTAEPEIEAANADLVQLISELALSRVLFNGRLYVEQGGHAQLEQADVVSPAYDDYGRAIPGQATGHSLAEYEALIAASLSGDPVFFQERAAESAQTVLQDFLTELHLGHYDEAAYHYAGDYDWLRQVNPDVPADDTVALLARGCELNGLVCLNITGLELIMVTDNVFTFSVQFANEDGSLFELSGCCGDDAGPPQNTFEFHVWQNEGGQYLVQDLPPYRP